MATWTYRAERGSDCAPEVLLGDMPCSRDVILTELFQADRYADIQRQLVRKLETSPRPLRSTDSSEPLARWCYDVSLLIVQALDATNLRPVFLPVFPRALGFFGDHAPDTYIGVQPLSTGPRTWPLPSGAGVLPASVVLGPGTVTREVWGRSRQGTVGPAVPVASGSLVVGAIGFASPARGIRTTGLQGVIDSWNSVHGASYLTFQRRRRAVTPCLRAEGCWEPYTTWDVPVASAWVNVVFLQALARDLVEMPFPTALTQGLASWLAHLEPFAARGFLDIRPEQLRSKMQDLARANLDAQAAGFVAGATLAGSIAGPIIGGIVGAIAAALVAIARILPLAAGWSCPMAPFKRTVRDSACRIDQLLGGGAAHITEETLPELERRSGRDLWTLPGRSGSGNGNGSGMSTGTKVALALGGAGALAILIRVLRKGA